MKILLPDKYGNGGVEWWVVIETNINWLRETAHVVVAGWINEQAYLDGKQPIDSKSYDYSGDDFPFKIEELDKAGVNTLSVAYEKIQEPKIVEEIETPEKEGDEPVVIEKDINEFSASVKV